MAVPVRALDIQKEIEKIDAQLTLCQDKFDPLFRVIMDRFGVIMQKVEEKLGEHNTKLLRLRYKTIISDTHNEVSKIKTNLLQQLTDLRAQHASVTQPADASMPSVICDESGMLNLSFA